MLQAVRVFAITTVCGSATGLHIGSVPVFGSDRTQEGRRMKSAGADFNIQRLQDYTALSCPELLQGQNESLKGIQVSRFVHTNAKCCRKSKGCNYARFSVTNLQEAAPELALTASGDCVRWRSVVLFRPMLNLTLTFAASAPYRHA